MSKKSNLKIAESSTARRSPDFGGMPGLAEAMPAERTLEMYRRMHGIRAFELCVQKAATEKRIKCPVYLSLGQESVAAAVSMAMGESYVLPQHRCHAAYLSFGGDPVKLIDELLGLPSGCSGGMGGSVSIHDMRRKIVGHVGLVGDQVPVAVGIALAEPAAKVVTFFGDGAAEEDYVLSALGYAASRKVNVLFVCDDNDLSVLTPTSDRRTWLLEDVTRAFGMPSVDISDDPWLIEHHVRSLSKQLPALINIRTCRDCWHVGSGSDGSPEWDRFSLVEEKVKSLGLGARAEKIAAGEKQRIEALWNERLRIPSGTSRGNT